MEIFRLWGNSLRLLWCELGFSVRFPSVHNSFLSKIPWGGKVSEGAWGTELGWKQNCRENGMVRVWRHAAHPTTATRYNMTNVLFRFVRIMNQTTIHLKNENCQVYLCTNLPLTMPGEIRYVCLPSLLWLQWGTQTWQHGSARLWRSSRPGKMRRKKLSGLFSPVWKAFNCDLIDWLDVWRATEKVLFVVLKCNLQNRRW